MANDQSTAIAGFEELWERLRREAIEHLEATARDYVDAWHHCESPIEQLFAAAWELSGRVTFNRDDCHFYELRMQREVPCGDKVYRVDFTVTCVEKYPMNDDERIALNRIAIELDGHDFHERTKEQVAYRNARDRALQAEGWKVFHFSGSEVWRAPMKCVAEVDAYCESEILRLHRVRNGRQKVVV